MLEIDFMNRYNDKGKQKRTEGVPCVA